MMADIALIMWADEDDSATPEREEASAAVSEILSILSVQIGGSTREKLIQRVLVAQGISNRRGYDLGWNHCEDSLHE